MDSHGESSRRQIKVTVKLGAPLSQVVGETRVILPVWEGVTVADVLSQLKARYPGFDDGLKGQGLVRPLDQVLYALFVNARPVPWEQAQTTPLKDGDRIYLFLPIAGG